MRGYQLVSVKSDGTCRVVLVMGHTVLEYKYASKSKSVVLYRRYPLTIG